MSDLNPPATPPYPYRPGDRLINGAWVDGSGRPIHTDERGHKIPVPKVTERGFQRHLPVESEYGGEVTVYESSAASGPHIWLNVECPENLNDPEGNTIEAVAHLTLENATLLRDQLTQLIDNHYQL